MLARAAALSLILAAAVPVLARESWREAVSRADSLAAAGKPREAAAAAQAALAEVDQSLGAGSPEAASVLVRLAEYYESTLDVDGLNSVERRLLALSGKDAGVWLALGKLARGRGRGEAAVEYLRKARTLPLAGPEEAWQIDEELGSAYLEAGRYAEAARSLQDALSLGGRPRCWTYIKLAGAYHYMGRHERAQGVFERVKKLAPDCLQAYVQEGYGDLEQGKDEAAKKEFEALVAIDTASAQGYRHVASLLYYRGRYREAEAYFRKALAFWRDVPRPVTQDWAGVAMWLGIALKAQKRPEEAEEAFLRVERESRGPSTDERFIREHALHQLGLLYDSMGRGAQAERAYQDALDVCQEPRSCPGFWYTDALLGLAGFYAGHGRKTEAGALMARVAPSAFSSANPMVFAMRWNMAAGVYEKLGQGPKAGEIYRKVLALFPPSACGPDLLDSLEGIKRLSQGEDAALYRRRLAACRAKLAAAQSPRR